MSRKGRIITAQRSVGGVNVHSVCVSDGEEQRNVGPKTMGDRLFCYLLRQPVCSLKLMVRR